MSQKMPNAEKFCLELFAKLGVDVDPDARKALMSLALTHTRAYICAVLEAAENAIAEYRPLGTVRDKFSDGYSQGVSDSIAKIRQLKEEL
ncbi:MAG: hypothetical protein ACE5JV_04145 [Nitrososphaerales archaeon]